MVNGFTDFLAVDAVSTIQITSKTKDKSEDERKKTFVAKKRILNNSDESLDESSISGFTVTTYDANSKIKTFVYGSKEYS